MELKDKISIEVSKTTGVAQHEVEELASSIAGWCADATVGKTRQFELSGWLLIARRKESKLSIVLAPATVVTGSAFVKQGTPHQMLELTLD